jgi:hypothetical protein
MEKYRLSWTPSIDDQANEQTIKATIDGGSVQTLAGPLLMNVNTIDFNFPTGAQISWFVTTVDVTGTKTADSQHDVFQATNQAPLLPATNLAHAWVQHIP